MTRLFGQNGQFDSFVHQNTTGLLDTSGPEWRWSAANPGTAGLQPTSAEELHWAQKIDDLLTQGLQFKVEPAGFGGQVTAVELGAGGNATRFEAAQVGARPFNWTLTGLQEAHVTLFNGQTVVKTYHQEGPWALFRLMDQANRSNAGPTAIKATFGEGAAFATLTVTLPTDSNPFGRGGVWSFRCPASL
jgi:type VI secretion system protein ImpL